MNPKSVVYSAEDQARALDVYRRRGFTDALEAGPWKHATLARWVGEVAA